MAALSEDATRKQKIDIVLKKCGWNVKNKTQVIEEVDTKQSDFVHGKYKTKHQTLKSPEAKAYADYLLLDSKGLPLAVIEAKRTSKDPIAGQRQAEDYVADIKAQTGKDTFIFLTNGYEIWFWNKPNENPRMVSGFHDRDSLETKVFQNSFKKYFQDAPIKEDIVDRPYQIEAVKRVLEGIDAGKRKFLIVQATGTGKTRVAMAIIDVLMRANRAKRILFLVDRKELRRQAFNDNFKRFFPKESKQKVFSATVDKNSRLYASTIQTFMECYQDFSCGFFDLIISDEAHRSIYNKWKEVFTYFDAIKIGLTATPSDLIDRDTYRFFDCPQGVPTHLYSYEEAVDENYLVDFQVYRAQTHFQIEGINPEDVPNAVKKKVLEETGVDEEELNFEGTDIEKKVIVVGTNEAIVKEFMDNCVTDETGTLPAKSIFFAISKKHAKRLWEAFEKLYPQYKGKLARIITSEVNKPLELIKEFKEEDFPKIAISVDMLDTGVDVPEVCNLAFVKPVFSKIKFWQMIGRGTRNDQTVVKDKHRKWLPNGKKEGFLIFDFWKNFEWFDMHPEGREAKPTQAVPTKIFVVRLQQLAYFLKSKDPRAEHVKAKIAEDMKSLPLDSASIKEHKRDLEKAMSPTFWNQVGINHLEFLKTKIAPLMKYKTNVNVNEAYFMLKIEQLSLSILRNVSTEVERFRDSVGEYLQCLPTTINAVKVKKPLLEKVLVVDFWENVSYEDAQMLGEEFTPLMRYKQSEPRPVITLDIDDVIQESGIIEYGTLPYRESVKTYIEKVENRIKRLAEKDPTIQKIKRDEVLTDYDLDNLEWTLNSPELYITEEVLQKAYRQSNGTLVQFIKKVLGLYSFPDPKKKIEDAFKAFMIEKNYLSADQVNFLRTIQTVFTRKHHIEYKDLFEPPFTNFGVQAPIPLFEDEDLREVIQLCSDLERDLTVASS